MDEQGNSMELYGSAMTVADVNGILDSLPQDPQKAFGIGMNFFMLFIGLLSEDQIKSDDEQVGYTTDAEEAFTEFRNHIIKVQSPKGVH